MGTHLNIGDGRCTRCTRSTFIWSDPWVPGLNNFRLSSPAIHPVSVKKVVELINHRSLDWNHQVVRQLFIPSLAMAIFSIQVAAIGMPDSLV